MTIAGVFGSPPAIYICHIHCRNGWLCTSRTISRLFHPGVGVKLEQIPLPMQVAPFPKVLELFLANSENDNPLQLNTISEQMYKSVIESAEKLFVVKLKRNKAIYSCFHLMLLTVLSKICKSSAR